MKKISLIFLLGVSVLLLNAQERYLDPVFSDVKVTPDVTYGVNATMLYLQLFQEAVPEALQVDIYEPEGDTRTDRPLVILFHSGNFIPPSFNGGCSGTRKDATPVEIAKRFARMGYVAASASYRLGWDPTNLNQTIRVYTLINAAYRGVQDSRTAVRFFKKSVAEAGNPYGIDPNKIMLFGIGTGGYITYASSTIDTITDTWIPKFVTPQGPMVNEPINGNPDATTYGVTPFAIPPFPANDTLCYPNHVGYSSNFQMSVALGGALGDTSWIDANDPPMLGLQITTDPFAPYYIGDVIVPPPLNLTVVEVMGSGTAIPIADRLGTNDPIKHAFIDPVSVHADAVSNGVAGLYPFFSSDPTEGSPWSFENSLEPYGIAGSNCDTAYYTQSRPFLDSILTFVAPRACLALDLGCNLFGYSAVKDPMDAATVGLKVSPNPASDVVRFHTADEFPMEHIYVYDLNGRLVKAHTDIKHNQFTMLRNNLPAGTYIAKVMVKDGFVSQKLMFR